jgi:hypothetical protein
MNRDDIVRSEVRETSFGFISDEEILKLSTCKVISSLANDALGNFLIGFVKNNFSIPRQVNNIFLLNRGLYDPKMGCVDMTTECTTCFLPNISCPGHSGHIELDVPVIHYNIKLMKYPKFFS